MNFWHLPVSRDGITVLLLRHGQSDGGTSRSYIGQTDVAVTSEGKKQAEKMGTSVFQSTLEPDRMQRFQTVKRYR
jgi:broad specificity phosphatase PhoE